MKVRRGSRASSPIIFIVCKPANLKANEADAKVVWMYAFVCMRVAEAHF